MAIAPIALDMQQAIAEFRNSHHQNFSIRIDIHSGPVVAGAISLKKFIYDWWKDNVTTAYRMKYDGTPGCI